MESMKYGASISGKLVMVAILGMCASGASLHAQSAASGQSGAAAESPQAMQERMSRA